MIYWENGVFYLEQNKDQTRKEVTKEEWQRLLRERSSGKEIISNDNGYPIAVVVIKTDDMVKRELRLKREKECFSIINRGQLWHSRLSLEQLNELNTWYQEWLDVTTTKIIPTKPLWLK